MHHKIHLTPELINNPRITLDWNNLELLCESCHKDEHKSDIYNGKNAFIANKNRKEDRKRYYIDDNGNVCIKIASDERL